MNATKLDKEVGLIAQQVKKIIPDAVVEAGNVELTNGEVLKNILHVDKNRVYIECVGAVIELGKKAEYLDDRIDKIEQKMFVPLFEKNKQSSFEMNAGDECKKTCFQSNAYMTHPYGMFDKSREFEIQKEKHQSVFCKKLKSISNLKTRSLLIFLLIALLIGFVLTLQNNMSHS